MKLEDLPGQIPDSELACRILEEHPEGLVKVLIHGRERVGKSIYAINVMWEIYEALGYDEDEAYEKALDNLFLWPQKFLNKVDSVEEKVIEKFENQEPAMCLDDAGVGLGGALYDLDRDVYWELRETWPTMGTYTTGLFLTTPEPGDITEKFKGWTYRVKILPDNSKDNRWARTAKIYYERTDAIGEHRYATKKGGFEEDFSCYLPDKWFKPYYRRRAKFRREIKKRTSGEDEEGDERSIEEEVQEKMA